MKIAPHLAVLAALLYSLTVSFQKPETLFLLPIIYLFFLLKFSLKDLGKKLLFLNIFIVVIALTVSIEGGAERALEIFLRINLILIFNLALFSNSAGYDIARGLYHLKLPKKFVALIYFSVKMNHTLFRDLKNIRETLKIRSFRANTSLFSYRTFGNVLGMLFVRSLKHSRELEESLSLRDFKGEVFFLQENSYTIKDLSLIILIIITTFGSIL